MASNIEKDAKLEVRRTSSDDLSDQNIDADEAIRVLKEYGQGDLVLDAATNARLLRRIDMMLMPVRSIDSLYRALTDSLRSCPLSMDLITWIVRFHILASSWSSLTLLPEVTLSYASIMGLKTDIHLVGDNYQWLGSVFYFGMLFSSSPPYQPIDLL